MYCIQNRIGIRESSASVHVSSLFVLVLFSLLCLHETEMQEHGDNDLLACFWLPLCCRLIRQL